MIRKIKFPTDKELISAPTIEEDVTEPEWDML